MKALVTGASGFLGVHLCRRLLELGWEVRALDTIDYPDPVPGLEVLRGNVRDEALLSRACRGADSVFHCAALVPLTRSGDDYLRVNVDGTRTVLQACLREGVRKTVFISSSAVYGRPLETPLTERSPYNALGRYGQSKRLAEDVCAEYKGRGLDISIIRPRTLVGPGRLGILQLLFEWLRLGKRFYILGSGDNKFQLLSARDCVEACVLCSSERCFQEDFNLGAERFSTLRQDLEALARHAGTGGRIMSVSPVWARPALRAMDLLRLSPLVDWHYQTLEVDWYFDVSKARECLKWKPKDSNLEMLASTYDWYLQNAARARDSGGGASVHRSPVVEGLLSLLKRFS